MKRTALIVCALLMGGCATTHSKPPTLGRSDTAGFVANGASVKVEYQFQTGGMDSVHMVSYSASQSMAPKALAKLRESRVAEVNSLLTGYGFKTVPGGAADYTVRILERGEVNEPDSMLLSLLSSFSMLIIPATHTATRGYDYELWSQGLKVHNLETRTEKKRIFGLIGIPLLAINAGGSVDRGARIGAHDSVLSLWIDQGSFE